MALHSTIGIDLGGTKTLCILFDERFQPIEAIKFKTEPARGWKAFDKRLAHVLERLLEKAKKKKRIVEVVGVGCAGHVDARAMTLRTALNIPFLNDYPLIDRVKALTQAPVFLGNDAHLGLYGEQQLGAAIGVRQAIGIFVGTGIGGALMIDGKIHLGTGGFAGNIGHYLVQPLGPLGGSDRQGVLDDFVSRTAIAAEAATFVSKQWAPALARLAGTDIVNIRSSVIAEAIHRGDKQIEELVRSRARILGIVLSNLVDFINPEVIVLGGGLVEAMPGLILKEVTHGIKANSTAQALENLKVVTVKLGGRAVATGAAKMAWDRTLGAATARSPRSGARGTA